MFCANLAKLRMLVRLLELNVYQNSILGQKLKGLIIVGNRLFTKVYRTLGPIFNNGLVKIFRAVLFCKNVKTGRLEFVAKIGVNFPSFLNKLSCIYYVDPKLMFCMNLVKTSFSSLGAGAGHRHFIKLFKFR